MLAGSVASAQEKTVCDSPCKMILLPLIKTKEQPVPTSNPLKELQGKTDGANRVIGLSRDTTYFAFQVEKPVRQVDNGVFPHYPDTLKVLKIDGEVVVAFVVDTLGLADLSSVKVLKSTHKFFTDAVLEVLSRLQFIPAQLGGRKVQQLVQQPFVFNISK
jgi:protein TonB